MIPPVPEREQLRLCTASTQTQSRVSAAVWCPQPPHPPPGDPSCSLPHLSPGAPGPRLPISKAAPLPPKDKGVRQFRAGQSCPLSFRPSRVPVSRTAGAGGGARSPLGCAEVRSQAQLVLEGPQAQKSDERGVPASSQALDKLSGGTGHQDAPRKDTGSLVWQRMASAVSPLGDELLLGGLGAGQWPLARTLVALSSVSHW